MSTRYPCLIGVVPFINTYRPSVCKLRIVRDSPKSQSHEMFQYRKPCGIFSAEHFANTRTISP